MPVSWQQLEFLTGTQVQGDWCIIHSEAVWRAHALCHNAAGCWGCQASALQHVALCCNHCVMTAVNACNPNTARQQVLHLTLPRTCKRASCDTFQLGHASAAVRSRTVIRQLLLHIKAVTNMHTRHVFVLVISTQGRLSWSMQGPAVQLRGQGCRLVSRHVGKV
jgi:hypothetical protein